MTTGDCKHYWESWLDEEQWQCCYCGTCEAIVNPDAIACIEAERDAVLLVLRQLVAADDERTALVHGDEWQQDRWNALYDVYMIHRDDALSAARALLAGNGAGAETG